LKEPVYAVAGYPFFTLSDPSTTVFLSSVRDHPIQLNSALYPGIISSYSLISPTTEAFITPHSILYPSSLGGTKFLTGSDSLICLFDVSRPGKDGPVSMLPTIPSKRKKIVGGGVGMKGIVSSMAENPAGDGILAAGTFTRHVGLYAAHGSGDTIATFSVADTDADQDIGGKGITQVLWSPCGRYLYVVERMSDGVLVYDIRVTGQLVGWLKGRKAVTNQRMKVDVVAGSESGPPELWAGGTDGVVRMWTDPSTASEGTMPAWEMQAHSSKSSQRNPFLGCATQDIDGIFILDAVSSAVVHPMGGIIATCSGQKHFPDFGDEVEVPSERKETSDNSLQIWWLQ
jgi:hypothetical protein